MRIKNLLFLVLAGIVVAFFGVPGSCESQAPVDPNQFFYKGNADYKSANYADALLAYDNVLNMGLESGNLYYNIGNSFFKTNKIGYAILFYERAKEIMPYDSDLRSNLEFARSMVNEPSWDDTADSALIKALKRPYRDFSLSVLSFITLGLYLFMILLFAFNIMNPMMAKRARFVIVFVVLVGLYTITVFCMRYYGQEIQKKGVVLVKDVESKYEPIDKSATFFKLQEGAEVIVLSTRDGWRQVRRADGKIGWVKKEKVEPI
ncbi:MAG TPA: SH3 domain-containing protein [Candidatus Omnitrophota bacterium]|nr:SH3 domain-containing protein [Candidatus Omnitrophota bacterium]